MTDIETLKDILHREKLKEDEKHVGIPSWDRQFNELATSLGHGDLSKKNHRKITEYLQLRKIDREYENQQKEYYFLGRAKTMLLIGMMYPFALLILLFVISKL